MKKIKIFGLASTLILAGAAGFTSCSSDSADPIGGGTGVAGQVVKTQFAINIPYGGNGSSSNLSHKSTRMGADIAQQDGTFRGISNILLLTFQGDPETAANANTAPINIGEDNNAYDKDNYRRLYRDIEIPLGTDHMIFYGRAKKENTNQPFKYGQITVKDSYTSEKTLAGREFMLTPITKNSFEAETKATEIISQLNKIAASSGTDGFAEVLWSDADDDTKYNAVTWITKQERDYLKKRYEAFINLKAGSANSVKAFINNLKATLIGEGTQADLSTKYLTKAIVENCDAALTALSSNEFPRNLNLPDGVATVNWDKSTTSFVYNTVGNENLYKGNNINYQKICYPAELSYFVNTETMVSDKNMSNVNAFPVYKDWTEDLDAAWPTDGFFSKAAVNNSTRTVALRAPIQYSVAVLKSTIRCKDATLKDNASKVLLGDKVDQDIKVPTDGIKVTAILIGGQPEKVDWKYEPTATETFAHTIYDKEMNGGNIYAKSEPTVSNPNYTIVFDNKDASGTPKSVFVTVELENNTGQDFYGSDGLIPKGSKFYLVGELKPSGNAAEGVKQPTGSTIDRVFLQDHVTTANFTIGDLKKAYNCIPDLRSSGINVGLAVDLTWKDGITFDVDL